MKQAFDHIAEDYDRQFTFTEIGRLQRKRVWEYLDVFLQKKESRSKKKINILELNCGTGEDALRFARKGHQILATDISEKMVQVTQAKIQQNHLENLASTQAVAAENLSSISLAQADEKFDLIFSNFGGLNCLTTEGLNQMAQQIPSLLKSDGHFIAVVMPSFCLWESFYFLFKGKRSEILRRQNKAGVQANVEGLKVPTWYYSPAPFHSFFKEHFKLKAKKPIGFMVPPSYLEFFFAPKPRLLQGLDRVDGALNKLEGLAGMADHYLIDLVSLK